MTNILPTLGRVVLYKSKIDNGLGNDVLSPAMVLRTRGTTVAAVVERWAALPPGESMVVGEGDVQHRTGTRPADLVVELPDDFTVDLVVHGLGKDYREYAVPFHDGEPDDTMPRHSWCWPPRV